MELDRDFLIDWIDKPPSNTDYRIIEPFAYKDIEVHLVKVKGGDNNGSLKKDV